MNKPTDAEIDAAWRESVAKHESTTAFVRDFARAVLAKWGSPVVAGEVVARLKIGKTKGGVSLTHIAEPAAFQLPEGMYALYTAPQPVEREPLPGIKPGDFFGGRPEYAMEIDPDDFYGITSAIHHAIEMLNEHEDENTNWSPLDPKRSRRLQQALMAAWILEYPKEAAAHGIKIGGQHGAE